MFLRFLTVFLAALLLGSCGGGGTQTQTSPTPTASPAPAPTPTPTTTIGGRVFNTQSNDPIAGATVEIVGTELKTTTDGEGRYRIEGIRTTAFTVKYSHPDYPSVERNRTVQLGTQLLDLNVGLTPTTTIAGRVFNTLNNDPIAGATVEIVGTELKTTTDGEGRYRIEGIRTTAFTVKYSHPDYPSVERNFTQRPGNQLTDINVGLVPPLPPGVTVTIGGWVWDESPPVHFLGGVLVELLGADGQVLARAETNSQGNSKGQWKIQGVTSSVVRLRFSHPDYVTRNVRVSILEFDPLGLNYPMVRK